MLSPGRVRYRAMLALKMIGLCVSNVVGTRKLVGGPGPIVTLTSFGGRVRWSFLAIESIACGTLRPARTILWLDDIADVADVPKSLQRLSRRGLEIRITESYGPHTKYFPLVAETDTPVDPMVTADDDIVYPRSWLERLATSYAEHPEEISCFRARKMEVAGPQLGPYEGWPLAEGNGPSHLNFLTGVSGAIYPPSMQRALKDRGTEFLGKCPKADDVWLNNTALRSGIQIRLVDGRSHNFSIVKATQGQALKHSNVEAGRNDIQIGATYTADDVRLLRAEHGADRGY